MGIDVADLIGQPEGQTLEYKATLAPSKNIAQLICSFANAEGGYIIFGYAEHLGVVGLSSDFRTNSIVYKAIDMLQPKPNIEHQYINYNGKNLYVIKIDKTEVKISLEGKIYKREGKNNKLENPIEVIFNTEGFSRLIEVDSQLNSYKSNATNAKRKLLEHYQSILKIIDDLGSILYPMSPGIQTNNQEGKILIRILFSSLADNFETYLSDLLYEIFLAKPETLKSEKNVTIKEVLDCSDIQEFVHYWANKQIGKLQKGSVKGFIDENKQIKQLNAISTVEQTEIEKILQIRHLYSHRNGVIDEKFLQFFSGQFELNSEHKMSINEMIDKLVFLSKVIHQVDMSAINKYGLEEVNIS